MGSTLPTRPLRSLLYVPGSNARALEKARTLPADGLIIDLEDSVAPQRKAEARQAVADWLKQGEFGHRLIIVRINAKGTDWYEDDWSAIEAAHGIALPKVESPEAIKDAESRLPVGATLWPMIETPKGVVRANEIAAASDRLEGIILGTSDLIKDLGAQHQPDRQPLMTSLQLCILAARAKGLAIIDGVHLDLSDDEGLAAVCQQGRALGFDGKSLIHPKTIAAANEAFGPTEEEIAEAQRVVNAFAKAEKSYEGVTTLDGKLVEALHVEAARRTILIAAEIRRFEV